MNPSVSMIIPVYNVHLYIKECLDSVFGQDYDNLEIILVDDGSTDESGTICDEYAKHHSNAKVIHQTNQGLSGARNNGVGVSSGEYITFVDSDDVISKDYTSILIKAIIETNADVAIARSVMFWDHIPQKKGLDEIQEMTAEKALIEMCNGYNFGVSACCKMYKRMLVEKYPYPLGKLYEDLATSYKIIGDCKRIAYVKRYLYFYRQRNSSISNGRFFNERQLYGLEAAKEQLRYIEKHFPTAIPAAQARCVLKVYDFIPLLMDRTKESKKIFKILRAYVRENATNLLASSHVNMQNKIRYLSIISGYNVSLISVLLFNKIKDIRAQIKD